MHNPHAGEFVKSLTLTQMVAYVILFSDESTFEYAILLAEVE